MYATITIVKRSSFKGNLSNYMTVEGYTRLSGAPTEYMVKLKGIRQVWRRVYVVCRSNSATYYVKVDGEWKVVNWWDIQSRL